MATLGIMFIGIVLAGRLTCHLMARCRPAWLQSWPDFSQRRLFPTKGDKTHGIRWKARVDAYAHPVIARNRGPAVKAKMANSFLVGAGSSSISLHYRYQLRKHCA